MSSRRGRTASFLALGLLAALCPLAVIALLRDSAARRDASAPTVAPQANEDPKDAAAKAAAEKKLRDTERIQAADAKAIDLATAGDLDGAVAVLLEALREGDSPMNKAALRLHAGDLRYKQSLYAQALEQLSEAERLVDPKAAWGRRAACEIFATRSQVYLDQGLVDIAYEWAVKATQQIPELLVSVAKFKNAKREFNCDVAIIAANRADIRTLVSMEDFGAVDSAVKAALESDVYSRSPSARANLLAIRGLAFKESSRLNSSEAVRAGEDLRSALAVSELEDIERVLPELALAELALRTSSWTEAHAWIEGAEKHLGPPAQRVLRRAYANWLAMKARLVYERQDRPAGEKELAELCEQLVTEFGRRLEAWKASAPRESGYGHIFYTGKVGLISELLRFEMKLAPGRPGIERALGHLFAAGDVGSLARRLQAPHAELSSVRSKLLSHPEEHAILIYFPAPERTDLFVVKRDNIEHFELAPASRIHAARAAAIHQLQAPITGADAERKRKKRADALTDLAGLLLGKNVQASVKDFRRLTIVGRDLMDEVPFEAFPLQSGECLGLCKAISYLPSPAIGLALAERAERDPPRVAASIPKAMLLVGLPDGVSLDMVPEKLDEIAAEYPAASRRTHFGREATLELLKQSLPSARVVQLYTHGRRDDSLERPAGFLLASGSGPDPRFVGAADLEACDVPPLAVLTICGSGLGPKRRGDPGAADLAGACFSGGPRVRCVIQSSYDLHVEAARLLSIAFHAALLKGEDPSEALRKARVRLSQEERYSDLFYHELISAVGLANEPIFTR